MKNMNGFRQLVGRLMVVLFVAGLALLPRQVQAQTDAVPDPAERFSKAELTQMVAPIALYPDALLSQILMASTYPLEVIEADRWVRRNPGLKDEALDAALLDKEWDPSVKSLCHFPSTLALMSERISETTSLGNAFLAQEAEVMDTIQELRVKARAQGNLSSSSEQNIIVENETIVIEPVNPRVIYVPYYDPFYIYGPWWYPAYPPYYWGPVGVRLGFGISFWPGVYFGFSFGDWSYFSWHHHHIYIDVHKRPRYVRHDYWGTSPGPWHHVTTHRRGVAYRDKYTATKYGQFHRRQATDFRRDTRGFPERTAPALESDRRRDERPGIDRTRRGADEARQERVRQESPRLDRDRQIREQQSREKMERTRSTLEQQRREQVDRVRQTQDQQRRERVDRTRSSDERQRREQLEVDRPKRQAPTAERTQMERTRQERTRVDRAPQERVRIERQAPKTRENIFEQVDDGRKTRQSSERGRFSRQDRGGSSSEHGRPAADNRGSRQIPDRRR